MELQRDKPPSFEASQREHQHLPSFPDVPTTPLHPLEHASPNSMSSKDAMNIDNIVSPQSRPQRASSVTSGMSLEDLQAAEALEFLKKSAGTPRPHVDSPPRWVAAQSEYNSDQQEPLLHLLTSQVPLLSSAVNGSMYAYSQTKSYSPVIRYPAEFLERNIGTPMAGTIGAVGRRTGVEGGLRWALQGNSKKRKITNDGGPAPKKEEMDIERGARSSISEKNPFGMSEQLPVYDEEGRSPPYHTETRAEGERSLALQRHENQQQTGWQTRLMVSTSGLGIAMSDQSRQNLKYCLSWLRWANERLAGVIVAVTNLLKEWGEGPQTEGDQNNAVITARLQALSRDVAETVKKVVSEVSNYAGGALPQNAKDLVHRYFNSLPHRWRYASTLADTNAETQKENETVSTGKRVLALAREGLGMMSQVTIVINDTLVSAESWCDKLGRKSENQQQQQQQQQHQSITLQGDVKMEDPSSPPSTAVAAT